MVGNGEKIRFWEDLWLGDQPLCAQYSDLYRVIPSRNLTISVVLGSSPPSTMNLNFRRNLVDTEIEHFQKLLLSLGSMHLSPSTTDSRGWSLSSTCVFTIKSFFLTLSMPPTPLLFRPAKFIWTSKAPSKVKAFAWLVAHRKVNTNDLLQLKRPYRFLNPQWCILCRGDGESIDHLFLHCPFTMWLWHKLFDLARSVGFSKEHRRSVYHCF